MSNFKEGDWVRLTYRYYDSTKKVTVEKLVSESEHGYLFNSSITGRCYAPKEKATIEHWKPREGEWCWFWNDNNMPVVRKFKELLCTHYKYSPYIDAHFKHQYYSNCEPFIGTLPQTSERIIQMSMSRKYVCKECGNETLIPQDNLEKMLKKHRGEI